jgi:hypothetical protein
MPPPAPLPIGSALRLFLPKLRPVACVPDGPSATLANALGVESILRFPASVDVFGPILKAISFQADLIVIDATDGAPNQLALAATFHTLFQSLSPRADLLITLSAHAERAFFGNLLIPTYGRDDAHCPCSKLAPHVWLRLADPVNDCVALFISPGHKGEEPQRIDLSLASEAALIEKAPRRAIWRHGAGVFGVCDLSRTTAPKFSAALTEYRRSTGAKVSEPYPHNLWVRDGLVRVWLDPYQLFLFVMEDAALRKLNGYSVGAISTSGGSMAATLRSALSNARLRIAPELRAAVEQAAREDAGARAPFYALPPVQRLGWLVDHEWLFCAAPFGPFKKGIRYPVKCLTSEFTRDTERPNLFGEQEHVTLHAKDLVIEIQAAEPSGEGAGGGPGNGRAEVHRLRRLDRAQGERRPPSWTDRC